MSLRTATEADILAIRTIAQETWPVAYGGILSPAQLQYMLELMYSAEALHEQMTTKGHRFMLFEQDGHPHGFVGYAHGVKGTSATRLHKLYVLPGTQRGGVGRALLQHVIGAARVAGDDVVELNVNRFNNALKFYQKHGFRIVRDEVIDIGHGFVMDDHVLERTVEAP